MLLRKNQHIRLEIESISSDGNGVGRYEGMAVFVGGAAPGDVLDAKIIKIAKTHAFAIIHQVVTPGPGRQKPDCPVAHSCGGCAFRHLNYDTELAVKADIVRQALRRIGGLETSLLPILPSPSADRYRNKVQYPVAADTEGKLIYGFYAVRSHRPVPCADCRLQPPAMNDIAATVAAWAVQEGVQPYNEANGSGLLRHIYLRQNAEGKVLLCLVCRSSRLPHPQSLIQAVTLAHPQVESIVLNTNPANTNVILGRESSVLHGSGMLPDELCGVPVQLDIHSFFQVNPGAARQLFEKAAQLAQLAPHHTLLDLYCGTGVIGLSMAAQCKSLIGVESVPSAVKSAQNSARQMGLENTRFICADAAEAAQQLAREGCTIDAAVLDPPRKGAGEETLQALLQMGPARLLMISCNPATLARDLAYLCANGYMLQSMQPADLFPRTKHVECLALLTKT